jgi:G3E family GTPase
MLLKSFFHGDLHSEPEKQIQEIMRAILIRANFMPGVRYHLGWRGLKQSSAGVESWTAKIRGLAGVFGFGFHGLEPAPGWLRGRFLLAYFPDPGEELVERCSLRAAALTQAPDYLEKVRSFASHHEFSRLFTIGQIGLATGHAGQTLAIELTSLSVQRTIAEDGVRLPLNGEMVQVINPGGIDQDFPSFEVASGLFNALAASVTFNIGKPPVYLRDRQSAGTGIVYDRNGSARSVAGTDIRKIRLLLGYGEGSFEDLDEAADDSNRQIVSAFSWSPPREPPPDYGDRLWWRAHQLQDLKTIDKKILGIDDRPPFILLTGFLGSGKTSFLQHFIDYQTQRSRFVAVIQNEIGEIGLDGKLLDYKVTEIDEGCVCCSLVGRLGQAVHGILEEFSPDTIILETSGLANPKNLLDEFDELAERVRLDAIVTMVDAVNFEAGIRNYEIAVDQIAAADVIVLNKTDLVDEARLEALRLALKQLNPRAPILASRRGDVNPAMIFDLDERSCVEEKRSMPSGSGTGHHKTHAHGNNQLDSRTIRLTKLLDRKAFLDAVASLPPSIFRAKGIIEVSDPRQTLLFQYVAGRCDISMFDGARAPDRFLTLIGKAEKTDAFDAVERLIRSAALQEFAT